MKLRVVDNLSKPTRSTIVECNEPREEHYFYGLILQEQVPWLVDVVPDGAKIEWERISVRVDALVVFEEESGVPRDLQVGRQVLFVEKWDRQGNVFV